MGVSTIAGLALAAAGTGMSIAANQATTSAENQAVTDELALQNKYIGESNKVFNTSALQSSPAVANSEISTGQSKYKGEYAKADTVPVAAGPSETTQASRVLGQQTEAANQLSNSQRAQLGGYTEWDISQWIKNLEAQQSINLINSQAKAQEAVLPYKLYDASTSQNDLKTWGSIVSALGSVAGAAGSPAASGATGMTSASGILGSNQTKKSLQSYITDYSDKGQSTTQNFYMPYNWEANPLHN